jgi:hypothetical protein
LLALLLLLRSSGSRPGCCGEGRMVGRRRRWRWCGVVRVVGLT